VATSFKESRGELSKIYLDFDRRIPLEYKHIFLLLVALNAVTIICSVYICYKRGKDILSRPNQIKIYFWSTLPYLLLMAYFADISVAWKLAMIVVGLLCATAMFLFSNYIEKLRQK
jgi:hypothetical protein